MFLKYNEIEMEKLFVLCSNSKFKWIQYYKVVYNDKVVMFVTVQIYKNSVDFKYYIETNNEDENILDVYHTLYNWYFSLVFGFWHFERNDPRIFNN